MAAQAPLPALLAPEPTWGAWWWPLWMCAGVLAFTGTELGALATNAANTLSDYAQWQLGVYPGQPLLAHSAAWWVSLAVWLAVASVLTGHIWWGVP